MIISKLTLLWKMFAKSQNDFNMTNFADRVKSFEFESDFNVGIIMVNGPSYFFFDDAVFWLISFYTLG